MTEKRQKILLFKIAAIGDVLMTTPLIRQIRKNLPDAKIDYLVGNKASSVLKNNRNIDEVITFDDSTFLKKNIFAYLKLVSKIKKRKYDVIFVFDRHKIFNITAKLFGIPKRVGFDRAGKEGCCLTEKVFFDGTKHEIKYYLELGKKAGLKINEKDNSPEIFVAKEDISFADSVFTKNKIKSAVCIAPGGANNPGQKANIKLWPKEKYAELVRALSKQSKIILVGDKNDIPTSDYIINEIGSKNIVDLTGKTNIQQTAAIMKKCSVVICNDTGPMHMASSVNKKVISIFGPTDPRRFAPLHKESTYLWKHAKGTPCNDIYGSFKSCRGINYTEQITVEDVLKAYEKIRK